MIVKISKTEAINTRWLLWMYENEKKEAVCIIGRPGGSCGPERLLADCSFDELIARINDAS
jgi:hypothetical protein